MSAISLSQVQHPIHAVCRLHGSKSIANRALLIAALADGESQITQVPQCADTIAMINCLRKLGVPIESQSHTGDQFRVRGLGGFWHRDEAMLDCGDAGTTSRFILAAATLGHGVFTIDGSPQLRRRPFGPLVDALRQIGSKIESAADGEEHLPLIVHGSGLAGGPIELPTDQSSQFLSALMMVAPFARRDVAITLTGPMVSRSYVALTQQIMSEFGCTVLDNGSDRVLISAGQRYRGRQWQTEPDASNAAVFMLLAALTGGSVTIPDLHATSTQGDIGLLKILSTHGCRVEDETAGIRISGSADRQLSPMSVDLRDMPDLAPPLAVAAALSKGISRFDGIDHLRHKESDRVAVLIDAIGRLGGKAEFESGTLIVHAAEQVRATELDPHDDHRMAMSFALAATRTHGLTIKNPDCVGKSFPEFWEMWRGATGA